MSELDPRPELPAPGAAPSLPPPPRPEVPTSGAPPSYPAHPYPPPPYPAPPYPAPPYPPGSPQAAPYGYPPPYPYPYPVQPPYNTYAILATVFAFAVFAPLGIYFGTKAREQIARTGERGSELATVGIVAGWIISGLQAAFLVVWCGLFFSFFATFATHAP